MKNNSIKKPNNYSSKELTVLSNSIDTSTKSEIDVKPNIIAIMNESFSDLSVLGEFETNQDYIPFINSLDENTIKGYALSSVHGGGTSNSEFEFLTGNTMAFLPKETIAYQNYINSKASSLVSVVEAQGYTPIAIHPYLKTSWNRVSVYDNFGFNDFLTIDNFESQEYLRSYISDSCNYKKLIELYENKSPDEKLFLFNVTMQNHGPYNKEIQDNYSVYLTGEYENKFPQTNEYLSLIYKSDKAFEELVTYFNNVDEPTIIIMFGDHQPNLGDSFDETLLNNSLDNLSSNELIKRYIIPFVIWANYDIPEATVECTSINYLSNYLLDCTSLEKSAYQTFLSEFENKVPSINSLVYNTTYNNNYSTLENTFKSNSKDKLLDTYKSLEYNYLFDKKNKVNQLFNIISVEDD